MRMLLRQCKISNRIQCVFLSAGNSHEMGQVFLEAGIPHVICMTRPVNDLAQQVFFRNFYESVIGKSKKVCEAYKDAIDHLKWHNSKTINDEWPKYKLLNYCLKCQPILDKQIGEFKDFHKASMF